jgi:hypothetical protein
MNTTAQTINHESVEQRQPVAGAIVTLFRKELLELLRDAPFLVDGRHYFGAAIGCTYSGLATDAAG